MTVAETDAQRQARERVIAERGRREWSVRQAATEGGIANTTWGNYEKAKTPLTKTIRAAVAQAFEWRKNWPELMPEAARTQPDAEAPHSELEVRVAALETAAVPALRNLAELGEAVLHLAERVSALERRFPRRRDA